MRGQIPLFFRIANGPCAGRNPPAAAMCPCANGFMLVPLVDEGPARGRASWKKEDGYEVEGNIEPSELSRFGRAGNRGRGDGGACRVLAAAEDGRRRCGRVERRSRLAGRARRGRRVGYRRNRGDGRRGDRRGQRRVVRRRRGRRRGRAGGAAGENAAGGRQLPRVDRRAGLVDAAGEGRRNRQARGDRAAVLLRVPSLRPAAHPPVGRSFRRDGRLARRGGARAGPERVRVPGNGRRRRRPRRVPDVRDAAQRAERRREAEEPRLRGEEGRRAGRGRARFDGDEAAGARGRRNGARERRARGVEGRLCARQRVEGRDHRDGRILQQRRHD